MPEDSPPASTDPQILARVRPEFRRILPTLRAGEWYRVIPQPDDLLAPPLEGYIWLEVHGRPLSVRLTHVEVSGGRELPMERLL